MAGIVNIISSVMAWLSFVVIGRVYGLEGLGEFAVLVSQISLVMLPLGMQFKHNYFSGFFSNRDDLLAKVFVLREWVVFCSFLLLSLLYLTNDVFISLALVLKMFEFSVESKIVDSNEYGTKSYSGWINLVLFIVMFCFLMLGLEEIVLFWSVVMLLFVFFKIPSASIADTLLVSNVLWTSLLFPWFVVLGVFLFRLSIENIYGAAELGMIVAKIQYLVIWSVLLNSLYFVDIGRGSNNVLRAVVIGLGSLTFGICLPWIHRLLYEVDLELIDTIVIACLFLVVSLEYHFYQKMLKSGSSAYLGSNLLYVFSIFFFPWEEVGKESVLLAFSFLICTRVIAAQVLYKMGKISL